MKLFSTLPERLQVKIDRQDNGCWIWTGAKDQAGYGRAFLAGRTRSAHVIIYALLVGETPAGLELDHLCRVLACVSPLHLEPVTGAENRARVPRPTHCVRGHEFTPENTARSRRGPRACRACWSIRSVENYWRRKAGRQKELEREMDIDLRGSGEVVIWDWLYRSPRYAVLHAPKKWHDPDYSTIDEDAETACGLTGRLYIPGVFSRMSLPRCARCCHATGVPRGIGSPKNDADCRPLVEAQLAALVGESVA